MEARKRGHPSEPSEEEERELLLNSSTAKRPRQEDGNGIHLENVSPRPSQREDVEDLQKRTDGENKENAHSDEILEGDHKDDDGSGDDKTRNPVKEDALQHHAGVGSGKAAIGPRQFHSSTAMLDYLYHLLNGWPLNLNINKYEHLMLEDLLRKGHKEAAKKIGTGIKAFQVRLNEDFEPKCRCYYVIRKDGSMEDFSYRKCVDNILPLPSKMKANVSTKNKDHKQWKNNRGSNKKHFGGRGYKRGKGRRC